MKLGLGTAQFGMDYGITNRAGKVPRIAISEILQLAAQLNVRIIDTAPAYGDSEESLGEALGAHHSFEIVTKTPVFRSNEITRADAEAVESSLRQSLERLNQLRIHGLLVHHADDLLAPGGERLIDAMRRCVDQGLVSKIGVSVYTAEQIDGVLQLFQPGIVQLPLNVIDQRLMQSGHIARLHRMGVEIHARSVFLQGALLVPPGALPEYLAPLRDKLEAFHSLHRMSDLSALEGALAFITQRLEVAVAIVGLTDRRELLQVADAAAAVSATVSLDFRPFAEQDEALLDLAKWGNASRTAAREMQ